MNFVDQVETDIKSLKIQGATNVALAVLDVLEKTTTDVEVVGKRLAYARPTEPLAQNALRYILHDKNAPIKQRVQEYRQFIADAKTKIVENGKKLLVDGGSYLTICHSSTAIALFAEARAKGAYFSIFVAETRPLFQGRITAVELVKAGFDDVTIVIDDVAVSLIEGRKGKIDAVFLGADLLADAGFVNKVGSLAVAAAAERKGIPVYSLTTLLKFNPWPYHPSIIETRTPEEIWRDAPKGLQFYTPAFDYVPYYPNVRIISEVGIIAGGQVKETAQKLYPFIYG